jgi:phosphoglucosamine mutase
VPQILKSVRTPSRKVLEDGRVREIIDDANLRLAHSGRLVIRASGTEPVIRVMAEGDDAEVIAKIVDELVAAISAVAA